MRKYNVDNTMPAPIGATARASSPCTSSGSASCDRNSDRSAVASGTWATRPGSSARLSRRPDRSRGRALRSAMREAIREARQDLPETVFLNVSFVGSQALLEALSRCQRDVRLRDLDVLGLARRVGRLGRGRRFARLHPRPARELSWFVYFALCSEGP